ncbi:hypothetical protein BHECKSOX_1360 [Bathymodiolus heckerae thiotrophic gill symbiont]|uniref:hypothetical protein n=1 Tax=Bathymodiolus heckerae thiotrophic gill symbiont TaxID=1052212 RepID=UPI0010B62DE3|nr:hypothetical protein [Bathymodiolus heckerae thiotrophic gill symbiont]CAC9589050.1 hypothetical protein [uncultured Gammaproteobacteria bacterium]SHN91064.1 hypothetical protein BHECKSOX_1360 [Bathymodiolus heckerae thiotrophic gill symbiont]
MSIDTNDKNESREIAIALISLVVILVFSMVLLFPVLADIFTTHLEPGLGIKESAIIAFFITSVLMIIFTIASGDGLLGELQFLLIGFLLFFVTIWFLLAWIF